MIQRIQTIFLFLISILNFLLFFFPFEQYSDGNTTHAVGMFTSTDPAYISRLIYCIIIINVLIIGLSVYTIFQYKNRAKQIKLSRGLILASVFLISTLFTMNFFLGQGQWEKTYLWPSFLPVLSICFAWLAMFFIKKDDELVRSADRIR